MNLEEELRRMLKQVDEDTVPDLKSAVLPRLHARTDPWPSKLATVAAVIAVVAVVFLNMPAGNGPSAGVSSPGETESAPPSTSSNVQSPTPASPSSALIMVATRSPQTPAGDALTMGALGGEVRGDIACLWLESPSDAGPSVRTALLWPFGFGALADPIRLTGPDNQVLARVGDYVELGGGSPPTGYQPTTAQDPCRLGHLFSVSVVASVNGKRVDIGEGSLRLVTRQPGTSGSCPASFLDPAMLVMADQRLRLRMSGTDWDVTWPNGFSAQPGSRITIIDDQDREVMRQGVEVIDARGSVAGDEISICAFGEVTYP